ncbi:DUF7426 family protein [Subtercola endophyticus]|uniref:DUF7426 family protein n=1 Tax=Subtercola endophyticus TaxID=2895559 RepID=UPI001E53C85B|nr:hypothetical protein [Subtercola endophyticus]UFS58929.1 hypothetical protein LQ955_18360 [Subtercola endophyticus]
MTKLTDSVAEEFGGDIPPRPSAAEDAVKVVNTLVDLAEIMDPLMSFPLNGKVYTPPPILIETGAKLNALIRGDDGHDESVEALWRLLLGPVWDEMVADGVSAKSAERASRSRPSLTTNTVDKWPRRRGKQAPIR